MLLQERQMQFTGSSQHQTLQVYQAPHREQQ
jgi:hypothetical protein